MNTQRIGFDRTRPDVGKFCLLLLVFLFFMGCAQFQHKAPETLPFMDRAQTKTEDGVRVTVAVPGAEESEQIFGFPDYLKFRSCLTLFDATGTAEPIFSKALERFFGGLRDRRTLDALGI